MNDDTVEAATLLISKVGYLIDDKLIRLENTPEAERKPVNIERAGEYNKIYERFHELGSGSHAAVSMRVQLLIKNMLENRQSGWKKSKKANEGGPKKLDELRKEAEDKMREAEQN